MKQSLLKNNFTANNQPLIDPVINDALRTVTGCLRPAPSGNLPILAGIQPAELRCKGATLSLAELRHSGRITDGMRSGWRTLRNFVLSSTTSAPTLPEWPCQLTTYAAVSDVSAPAYTNGV